MYKITACLDANIYISAIAFGGKPLKVLEKAFNREYQLVTGPNILQEVKKNLLGKLDIQKSKLGKFLLDISEMSSMFVPSGNLKIINHEKDNLVIELALIGACDVLVRGQIIAVLPS